MKLRIGLIGHGDLWSTRYRPALRMLHDKFDVRAVYSTISKLAESTAAEFQADPLDGYRALVCRCDIDAVVILKQCWLGWLPALAACEAGKAVYWAAGLDFDPVVQRGVREAIEKSGVSFMAELPRRFAPATLRLKELIATRLGQPQLIRVYRQSLGRGKQPSAGGPSCPAEDSELVELVDWCRYVVGHTASAVTSVCHDDSYQALLLDYDLPAAAESGAGRSPTKASSHDQGAATPTPSGPRVAAEIVTDRSLPERWSEAASFRSPASMKVHCENGVAFIDLPSTLVWFDDAGRHVESLETESPVGERMLRQFHRSVTSLVRDLGGLADAYDAAAVVKAARESHEAGRRIVLDPHPGQS
ncbi:Gfo/Idh/MocA family oxidoreductase [Roseiconus nitratireducens]|uniref:Gfo/Idh/MocA family oxidoreductase n=1 Tax=Roseiconus nitratireducens TaxID=2605748 RepID=A0A5M6DL65_9BACT|nr:Gfo/Idh/MocA family oxidoreductase [Roseiconus nitratireducens]KAA5546900.1 Gfo/Idh/MocA family oxidoreductase [Roseiconus nitratireducens]